MATIRKRGRVWYSDIIISGKRIVRALDTDRRIAEKKLADMVKSRDADKFGRPIQDASWDLFKSKWLEHSKANKAPSTWKRDDMALRSISKRYPLTSLAQFTPALLSRYKGERLAMGRGTATVARDIRSLKAAARWAERQGMIPEQDWRSVSLPKEHRKKPIFLSPEQLKKLVDSTKGVWNTLVLLCSRAGLRRSEAYFLELDDIDWDGRRIQIRSKPEHNLKTKSSERWIPIPEDLASNLEGIRDTNQRWVIETDGKHLPSPATMSVYMRRIMSAVGVPGNIHTLRHTYASHLAPTIPLYTIARLMGHSSVKTTEIYSHLAQSDLDTAIRALPKI